MNVKQRHACVTDRRRRLPMSVGSTLAHARRARGGVYTRAMRFLSATLVPVCLVASLVASLVDPFRAARSGDGAEQSPLRQRAPGRQRRGAARLDAVDAHGISQHPRVAAAPRRQPHLGRRLGHAGARRARAGRAQPARARATDRRRGERARGRAQRRRAQRPGRRTRRGNRAALPGAAVRARRISTGDRAEPGRAPAGDRAPARRSRLRHRQARTDPAHAHRPPPAPAPIGRPGSGGERGAEKDAGSSPVIARKRLQAVSSGRSGARPNGGDRYFQPFFNQRTGPLSTQPKVRSRASQKTRTCM